MSSPARPLPKPRFPPDPLEPDAGWELDVEGEPSLPHLAGQGLVIHRALASLPVVLPAEGVDLAAHRGLS